MWFGSAKPVLHGTNSTEPNLLHLGETTYNVQGWMTDLNMLLSCFREKMSGANAPPFEYESLNALGSCCTANTAMPLYCAHIERRKASGKRTIGSMARHGSKLGGAGDRFGDYLCLDCANLPSVS